MGLLSAPVVASQDWIETETFSIGQVSRCIDRADARQRRRMLALTFGTKRVPQDTWCGV